MVGNNIEPILVHLCALERSVMQSDTMTNMTPTVGDDRYSPRSYYHPTHITYPPQEAAALNPYQEPSVTMICRCKGSPSQSQCY